MDRQKLTTTILIIAEAVLLGAVLVFSVLSNASTSIKNPSSDKQSEQTADNTEGGQSTEDFGTEDTQSSQSTEEDWAAGETRETFSEAVEQKLTSMTTEEKVAQLFLISPESLTGVDRVTISGNGTRDALNQYPVGGFIYSQKNFMGNSQATTLINGAQGYAQERIGVPLFILINEDAPDYASFATLSLTEPVAGIQICTYTNTYEIIEAIKDGMDMIYTPDNFAEIYGAVLEAVNDGDISQVHLENAVGSVLTGKME